MEERGLWQLFFATGLPQAYLAVRGVAGEHAIPLEEPAKTAFHPWVKGEQQI